MYRPIVQSEVLRCVVFNVGVRKYLVRTPLNHSVKYNGWIILNSVIATTQQSQMAVPEEEFPEQTSTLRHRKGRTPRHVT